jgi:general secretion pathway protein L
MNRMPRTLVLAMPDSGWKSSQACDYVLSADGRSVTRHGQSALATLPPADELVILVPPNRLSWHRVRVPPVAPRRMAAVLTGLLEDRLLDDPAQVCFAVAPGAPVDGLRLVAACDREWLQALIDGCTERRLRLSRIAPVHPPATDDAGRCDVVRPAPDGPLAVRIERDHVLAMPLEQAAALWPAREAASPVLLAPDDCRAQAESALGRVARAWSIDEALWRAAQSGWDLVQFDLADARRRPGLRRLVRGIQALWREPRWRALRWGLGLLAAAQVAGLNAWAWKLDGELRARREQARSLLLQSFPGVRTVVDAPLQMERELALLRRTRGIAAAGDADALLAAAAQVLPPGDGVQSLRYGAGSLTLTGARLDGQAWDQARARLSAQGLRAEREGERIVLRAETRP